MVHLPPYCRLIKVSKRPCQTDSSNKNTRRLKPPLHPLSLHNPQSQHPHQPTHPSSPPHSPLPNSVPISFRSQSTYSRRLHRKNRNRYPWSTTSLWKPFRYPSTTIRHPCHER